MALGVCSWSLQASSPAELVARVRACGLDAVQLHLDPLRDGAWDERATTDALASAGIRVLSGMWTPLGEDYSTLDSIRATGGLRPDRHWDANLAAARANAALAERLGLSLVTFHAGFLPHDARDPERAKLVARLRAAVDAYAEHGVALGFETGQETAETLEQVLVELDRPRAGVNFDPANMILYGMGEPVDALRRLAPFVRQIHVKDARRAARAGEWGSEVRVGTGEVDWRAFLAFADRELAHVDRCIEREAGGDRVGDIRAAREFLAASRSGARA
ncbi:MAG: sugar phosphate isomerase/epimerase [Planctomycetota bacterium]|nr:MAG: sugar phosphate isomerase/epimerase [Planctomycetota bacterium]